jgi:hypothetical protein
MSLPNLRFTGYLTPDPKQLRRQRTPVSGLRVSPDRVTCFAISVRFESPVLGQPETNAPISSSYRSSDQHENEAKRIFGWRKFRDHSILFSMVERWLYSLSPKLEWLGDYAYVAARRTL